MGWQEDCKRKKAAQIKQIPEEWRFTSDKLPPEAQLDVTDFPRTCGLLTPEEIMITELDDVDVLLAKLRTGELSASKVTVRGSTSTAQA
jgi:amidase